jgi:hypothetical protein
MEPDRSTTIAIAMPSRRMVVVALPVRGPARAIESATTASASSSAGRWARRLRAERGAAATTDRLEYVTAEGSRAAST